MKKNKKLKTIDKFNPSVKIFNEEDFYLSKNFNSGKFQFNDYICNDAIEDRKTGNGVTYIVIDKINDEEERLVAYYTLSTSSVHFVDRYDFEDDDIPDNEKREHYTPINAVMINMFAVNNEYQDTLYQEYLISDLILDIYELTTNIIGAKQIILCSVKDAVNFYKRNEFEEFSDELTLFDKDSEDLIPMCLTLHKSMYNHHS